MSTRAIVDVIGSAEDRVRLYCPSDGFVRDGLGEFLYRFCKDKGIARDKSGIVVDLLSSRTGFALNMAGEADAIDYVYSIDCSRKQGVTLSCWKVDWSRGGGKSARRSKKTPVDIAAELAKPGDATWRGLMNCPFCGQEPSTVWSSRKGCKVCCDDASCRGSSELGWFADMHDAELAWNVLCEKFRRKSSSMKRRCVSGGKIASNA